MEGNEQNFRVTLTLTPRSRSNDIFLVNVSPPKQSDIATSNFVAE